MNGTAVLTRAFDRPMRAMRRDPQAAVLAIVGVVIAYLALSPTVMLLYGSFLSKPLGVPGTFTLRHYIRAYSDPVTYKLLLNSFIFAAGSSVLATTLAAVVAWITVRTNAPFRKIFQLTAIVPNIFPPVMLAVAWAALLSPRTGLLNRLAMQLFGLDEAPLNIYSLWGMIFVEGLITTPLAFLIVSASLFSMDPSLEESARVAGSSNVQIARRITLPIVRPALLASLTLNFVRAIESFDTPAIIALPARIEVFTTKIYREAIGAFPPNQNIAATYAVSLLLISMVFVYAYRRLTARSERYVTVTGRGYRPMIIELGKWRYAASAVAALILLLIVVLPFVVLLFVSVVSYLHVPGEKTWALLTLDHYRSNLTDTRTYRALQNSLILAIGGATLCMLLASVTAYLTTKTKTAGRSVIEALTFIPWAFPGTALAIGLLWTYVYVPLPIYGTLWILLIGYITRFLPYGLRTMTSTVVQLHDDLPAASMACGAGFWATFRRIILPLLRPGFIAGWIILATIYLREFSTSIFLYSPGAEPVGPLLYHFYVDGNLGPMCSLGVIVSVICLVLIVIARRIGRARTEAEL
ncbi:MAG TPA: iron ABC transporter permease [Candidatus Binatia bacterium]|jgi:iron(III) transport system permease protein|nr:iron ABC transporter permease [Candidatus Binatia bacterium]